MPRSRLQALLERSVPHSRLTAVSAPAGYGKTTLLAEWARSSAMPVAWYSVDEGDNDAIRFLRYAFLAWAEAHPPIADGPLENLVASQDPELEKVLASFVNTAAGLEQRVVLVCDDFHLIDDHSIHQGLSFLVEQAPPNLHLVLTGRSDPPLPLARYRARGQLTELRADDLAFSLDETSNFVALGMELELNMNELALLHSRTEGWAAGLQLAAVRMRSGDLPVADLPVSGRERFIADYLLEDVFRNLSPQVQTFLLKTSVLDRLNASLCEAVTGENRSQEMLERIEREGLFLIALDHGRRWFRYHQLFAEFLRSQLDAVYPGEAKRLNALAAGWFLEHASEDEAFKHALAADDEKRLIEVIDRYALSKLLAGEYKALAGWLDAPAEEQYARIPRLEVYRGLLKFMTLEIDDCIRCLDQAERLIQRSQSGAARSEMGRLLAARSSVACVHNDLEMAEKYAAQALKEIPPDDTFFRVYTVMTLGDVYRENGRWEEAKQHYLKAIFEGRHSPLHFLRIVPLTSLADMYLRRGELKRAESHLVESLDQIQRRRNAGQWGELPLPVVGWAHLEVAEVNYEWNQLEAVERHLSRAIELAEVGGDLRGMMASYILAARLKLAQGDPAAAKSWLDKAQPLTERTKLAKWIGRYQRVRVDLWLAQGQPGSALRWARELLEEGEWSLRSAEAPTTLAIAWALIAHGGSESLRSARELLSPLARGIGGRDERPQLVEGLALLALQAWRGGDRPSALIHLEHSLQRAQPEGYLRVYVDLGSPMKRLLTEVQSRALMPEYVAEIVDALPRTAADARSIVAELMEPLTPREREVLELIAAGLTNKQIAQELVIAPDTVKNHASSIYAKLAVSNRVEAAATAREHNLLD